MNNIITSLKVKDEKELIRLYAVKCAQTLRTDICRSKMIIYNEQNSSHPHEHDDELTEDENSKFSKELQFHYSGTKSSNKYSHFDNSNMMINAMGGIPIVRKQKSLNEKLRSIPFYELCLAFPISIYRLLSSVCAQPVCFHHQIAFLMINNHLTNGDYMIGNNEKSVENIEGRNSRNG